MTTPTVTMHVYEFGFAVVDFWASATDEGGHVITEASHWNEGKARQAVMEGVCFWALVARYPEGFRVQWQAQEW